MIPAGTSPFESHRLRALVELDILDTPIEERFVRITRLAQRALRAPMAAISFLDRDRQWFKCTQGFSERQISRSVSFCAHALLESDLLVVPDLRADHRFFDHPFVRQGPGVAFYAGCPIRARDAQPVGAICVMDRVPRRMTEAERQVLRDMAAMVEAELQLPRASEQHELVTALPREERAHLLDARTGLWNRAALLRALERRLRSANGAGTVLLAVDVEHLEHVNVLHGRRVGDELLSRTAELLTSAVAPEDVVARHGSDEFIVLVAERMGGGSPRRLLDRIERHLVRAPRRVKGTRLSEQRYHVTATWLSPRFFGSATAAVERAMITLARHRFNSRQSTPDAADERWWPGNPERPPLGSIVSWGRRADRVEDPLVRSL